VPLPRFDRANDGQIVCQIGTGARQFLTLLANGKTGMTGSFLEQNNLAQRVNSNL
jgi:hypothetical protein